MDSEKALEAFGDLLKVANGESMVPADSEFTAKFRHIAGLKVGDKLRYKGGAGIKFPKVGGEVVVYDTMEPVSLVEKDGSSTNRFDFTSIFTKNDGDDSIREFRLDSRYFERVE